MKTSIVFSVLVLSFGLLSWADHTQAAEQQPLKVVPKISIPAISSPVDPKLYKPVSLLTRPIDLPPQAQPMKMNIRSNQIAVFDPIQSALDNYKRTLLLERAAGIAWTDAGNNRCWRDGFNQADQAAAGCLATDTIAVCYRKCSNVCLAPFETSFLRSLQATGDALETLRKTINNVVLNN